MKRIAVFCGSSNGASDLYIQGAKALGKELAKRNITLVYGGASVGVMGAVADAVLEADGHVIGVMPTFLEEREISHKNLSELIVVESMHERKAKMAELVDGFITLPGGPGTLEEFFEIFTWAQLGLHQKPCGLMNINDYYTPLISLFNHMTEEQFLQEKYRSMALVDTEPQGLLDQFNAYQPPSVKTYITKAQS
ncbi:TIGR00730 family Rossman fold protein [Priestia megaterium]|uniref:LOG family protein n=1 Tax=Priestia TaxID=2800373 RepID=UPI000BF97481|nr:TIGR00730 family Rossman fold protein [Priestia megaterium]RFB33446.1 TIGR00730 family Rossman fold protein [Bacillus sp. RC]MED3971285.1 TIGR00730 family Rossman fold protein [Priestia megaterium]PEX09402.1 TIGR00730 family Rossman fold protein [Priestia megaterium]PFO19102.1 TIGR00730 family Rossman fold protein [Priestia megaterium]PFT49242.1 TIGR00730 family Rossman fold protein [Priestia megaterium]